MATVWLNGELLEEAEARIGVLDRGVIWGYGLFETLRGYAGRIWAFDEHYARLSAGSDVLEIPVPGALELRGAADAVVRANGLGECGVRITVTMGAGPPDPHADPTQPPNAFVSAWPLRDYAALYAKGAKLVTVPGGGRPLAGVKTTSYAASVAGRLVALRAGGDDALFVAAGGRVLEATGANLFVARAGTIATPALDGDVLPGVTRGFVMAVARSCGFEAVERSVGVRDLVGAEEVLLTSTLREVYAAASLDGEPLAQRGIAARLREAYRGVVARSLG